MIFDLYIKYKKIVWGVTIALIIILLVFIMYRIFIFQVINTNPSNNSKISAGSLDITIEFNKDLKQIELNKQLFESDKIISEYHVEGSKLIIKVINLRQNNKYEIYLKNVESKNGDVVDLFAYTFETTYIPFSDLPSNIQKSQQETTDKGNIDDPILKIIPKQAYTFSIDPFFNEKGELIVKITLPVTNNTSKSDLVEYKRQALDFLKSNNINPNNYTIEWFPKEVANL